MSDQSVTSTSPIWRDGQPNFFGVYYFTTFGPRALRGDRGEDLAVIQGQNSSPFLRIVYYKNDDETVTIEQVLDVDDEEDQNGYECED